MSSAVTGRTDEFGPRDYDAIERAVMETPRGRWFLSERDKRRLTSETQRILDALKKLEAVMAPVPAPFSGTEVLRALAAHDHDTAKPLSATELTSASAEAVAQALSMKNMKYFKKDEAVFTPAELAASKLAVVETAKPAPAPPPKPAEAVALGARLVVNRIAPAAAEPAVAVAVEAELATDPAGKRRIVIIRRAAAEPIDVPLQSELAASTTG